VRYEAEARSIIKLLMQSQDQALTIHSLDEQRLAAELARNRTNEKGIK
jgi:hypothetical protein